MSDYSETMDYLYGLEKFGIVLGLNSVEGILSLIGNPHRSLKAIHIAGTNGKGSVAAMIAAVSEKAGYKTGMYTSPHLISFTERITVNSIPIAEQEVVELTDYIRSRIEAEAKDLHYTFFDFTTAMAFEYFVRKGVELAVVEVGLGGRLDSTNIITPLMSVITHIALDHEDYLGNTIDEIAREKAGIIKKGVPVVTAATQNALEVIKNTAEKKDLFILGQDYAFTKEGEQSMSYKDASMALARLHIGLRGDHQLSNAAVALCVVSLLKKCGFTFNESTIRESLASVTWPGRLELIPPENSRPAILLDGAHNTDGADALAHYLKGLQVPGKKILIFGVMKDKNYKAMLTALLPVVDQVILTQPDIDRAAHATELATIVANASVTDSVKAALKHALKTANLEDLIIIAGSFYTIGEAKRFLHELS
jgi:dihydrofolate synthase / folylpolyglutamate synthase